MSKILRRKDSLRCKCTNKKIPAGKKAAAALYDKLHQPKCPLTPCYAYEERWDGKNNGVKKEDIQFLATRQTY